MIAANDVEVAATSSGSRLADVRAKKALRAEEAEREREAWEVEAFDLVERFEKETNGGRDGVDFAVVNLTDVREGFVVVKLGEAATFKAFTNSKMNEADIDAFVAWNLLHPSVDAFRKIAARRPGCAIRCATRLADLFGIQRKEDAGK